MGSYIGDAVVDVGTGDIHVIANLWSTSAWVDHMGNIESDSSFQKMTSWGGNFTVSDTLDELALNEAHGGNLSLPGGRKGLFTVRPDNLLGSLQIEIRGYGAPPF
ncbi:hypothetical protein [Streptomyces sp. NPDC048419]|uniref:hypothetical protein n=1 Tax=Streptomyces sp. NPDC048419 TaxID=3365547 RepID=UPI00371A4AE4